MKFVVTGATGMIGRALINLILTEGDEAVALVNPSSSRTGNFPCGVEVIKIGLEGYNEFVPAFSADCFIHLAWGKTDLSSRDDFSSQQKNVGYTADAVKLAEKMGCKAFLGVGSQAEYGVKDRPLTGETAANPESEYGKAKLAACLLAKALCAERKIKFNWARVLSVYGYGDNPRSLISYLLSCFTRGEEPSLTKCEQRWDYIYCEDCARALYLIAKNGKDGKIYPVGSGECRLLKDYVNDVAAAAEYNGKICFGKKEYYPHQPMYLSADISELSEDTGFYPRNTFMQGIKKTLKEIKENS